MAKIKAKSSYTIGDAAAAVKKQPAPKRIRSEQEQQQPKKRGGTKGTPTALISTKSIKAATRAMIMKRSAKKRVQQQPQQQQQQRVRSVAYQSYVVAASRDRLAPTCVRLSTEAAQQLRVVLTESVTQIMRTRATVYLSLFDDRSAPCVACDTCALFMSVDKFAKHVHIDEHELVESCPIKLNIWPCPDDLATCELTPQQTANWNTFLGLASRFGIGRSKPKNNVTTQKYFFSS